MIAMFCLKSFFLFCFVLQSVSAFKVEEYKSPERKYVIWHGSEEGTNAHAAAKSAYEDMKSKRGDASIMACAAIDGYIYCASSSKGGLPGRPTDLEEVTQKELDECKKANGNRDHKSYKCAEIFLLNQIILWEANHKAAAVVYAYGIGGGLAGGGLGQAGYHKPCGPNEVSDKIGCQQLLEYLGWDSRRSRTPSPPPPRPPTPDQKSGLRPASSSGSSRQRSRSPSVHKRDEESILAAIYIRDMIDDFVGDWESNAVRDIAFEHDELWSRSLELLMLDN